MAYVSNKIVKSHLIVCEGIDARNFFATMIESLSFRHVDKRFANDIQVLDYGGNNDLTGYLEFLPGLEGYDKVKTLLIVRDAENDADAARKSIENSLRKNGLSVPKECGCWESGDPWVAYLLFPTLDDEPTDGALEDLCYKIINEENREALSDEIEQFLDDMKTNHGFEYPRIFKNRMHTYFSIKDKYVSDKIGEAAKANAFDWESELLSYFKNFMLEAFELS